MGLFMVVASVISLVGVLPVLCFVFCLMMAQ